MLDDKYAERNSILENEAINTPDKCSLLSSSDWRFSERDSIIVSINRCDLEETMLHEDKIISNNSPPRTMLARSIRLHSV